MHRRRSLRSAPAPVVLLWLLSVAVVATASCKNGEGQRRNAAVPPAGAAPAVVVDTGARQITFHVEVARTPEAQNRGLMFRERLAPDAGMLFVFDEPSVHTFWMKNTPIPLDMLFIDADRRIVGIVAEAEPHTLTPRLVNKPSQYVLEIGGGLAAGLGIRPGQRLEFRDLEAARGP